MRKAATLFLSTLILFAPSDTIIRPNGQTPAKKARMIEAPLFTGADMGSLLGRKRIGTYRELPDPEHITRFLISSISDWLPHNSDHSAEEIAQALVRSANFYGLDPLLLLALIQTESSVNPRAIGQAGEIGLMQIKPSTAAWIAKTKGWPKPKAQHLLFPALNIEYGAAYLAWLSSRHPGQAARVLTAYNRGPSRKHPARNQYSRRVGRRYMDLVSALTRVPSKDTAPESELRVAKQ